MKVPFRSRLRSVLDYPRAFKGRKKLRAGNNLLILGYHRVLPVDVAQSLGVQPGMFVTPETFRLHISILRQYVQIIDLGEWVDTGAVSHDTSKPRCAITFDDGWRDNFDYAYPIVREFNIPMTIFLATAFIGTERKFWPERLTGLLRDPARLEAIASEGAQVFKSLIGVSPAEFKASKYDWDAIIERLKSTEDDSICSALDEIEARTAGLQSDSASTKEFLEWEQVVEMYNSGLVQFGSHTAEHLRLSDQIDRSRIEEELRRSKESIKKKLGKIPTLFCYPNGQYSESVIAVVRRFYKGACTTERGWVGPADDALTLKRVLLSEGGSSQAHSFLARLA